MQKATPTWIHGLLQRILMDMLSRAGFKSASEVRLKIDPEIQLIPDVIATRGRIETAYPVTALDVVIEILSESDSMSRTLSKCRTYLEERVVFRGIWELLDQQLH